MADGFPFVATIFSSIRAGPHGHPVNHDFASPVLQPSNPTASPFATAGISKTILFLSSLQYPSMVAPLQVRSPKYRFPNFRFPQSGLKSHRQFRFTCPTSFKLKSEAFWLQCYPIAALPRRAIVWYVCITGTFTVS